MKKSNETEIIVDANESLNLLYGMEPEWIFVSETPERQEKNKLTFSIANTAPDQQFQFVNTDKLNLIDYLSSDGELSDQYNVSYFQIWFPWGTGKSSFATEDAGNNITVSPGSDNHDWICVKKSIKSKGVCWFLYPEKDTVIDPLESIDFIMDNIISQTPTGMSFMYIKNYKVPGYDNGLEPVKVSKKELPLEIQSFLVRPDTIAQDGKANLSWDVRGADTCILDPGSTKVEQIGQQEVTAHETKNFTMTAKKGSLEKCISVTLCVAIPKITFFEVCPNIPIKKGNSVTLNWSTMFASACHIDQGIGNVKVTGSISVTPQDTTIYTLTCEGFNGPIKKSVTVSVQPVQIIKFEVNSKEINPGQKAILSWEVINSDSINIDNNIGIVSPKGSKEVNPDKDTTYIITCRGPGGCITSKVNLYVNVVQITSFTSSMSGSYSWTTRLATTCEVWELDLDESKELVSTSLNGTNSVSPTGSYQGCDIRITCQGPGGPISKNFHVED